MEGRGTSGNGVSNGQLRAWEGDAVGGEVGDVFLRGVPVLWTGGASCAVGYGGGDTAKGGERLCWMVVPFLVGAA